MNKAITNLKNRHTSHWSRDTLRSLVLSLGIFAVAALVQVIADNYVGKTKGTAVTDLLLDHLPTADVDTFIILGSLLLTFIGLFLFLYKPKYVNFGIKALSIFIIVRAFLISLTHLGVMPGQLVFDTTSPGFGLYNILYNTSNDFFFSGHTGIPFLLGLVFWPERHWRYFFLLASLVFGLCVLVARIHYSIDVFAAPFITFSIFRLTEFLFPKDYEISRSS